MRRTAAVLALAVAGTLFAGTQSASACLGLPCDIANYFCHCLGVTPR